MRRVERFIYANDVPVVYWNVNDARACINAPTSSKCVTCPQKFLLVKSTPIVVYGIKQNFHRKKCMTDPNQVSIKER